VDGGGGGEVDDNALSISRCYGRGASHLLINPFFLVLYFLPSFFRFSVYCAPKMRRTPSAGARLHDLQEEEEEEEKEKEEEEEG
jgi:hypothetical protein